MTIYPTLTVSALLLAAAIAGCTSFRNQGDVSIQADQPQVNT